MGSHIETGASFDDRTYRVGRDRAGRWLAMETSGRGGGMFTSQEAAMRFAQAETARRPGAVMVSGEPIGFC